MEQAIGGKGGKFMKKQKAKYTDNRIGKIKIVDDFLPIPKDLVLKEETKKIIISSTKSNIEFFKYEAEKYNTNYQTRSRRIFQNAAFRFLMRNKPF